MDIELCANRLRRHRPGIRVSRGLAYRLLELRDPAAARTGMRRRDAEAEGGGNEQGCRNSVDGSTAHLHDVRSSPPRQIPSTRAPNTPDVRTTLSVGVESAIRAATAVLGTPPALSNSTALRKYHGGDTEDGRDNECSKHGFISVGLGLSVRYAVMTHFGQLGGGLAAC